MHSNSLFPESLYQFITKILAQMYKIILHILKTLQFVLPITLDSKTKHMYQNHFVLYFFFNFTIHSYIIICCSQRLSPYHKWEIEKKAHLTITLQYQADELWVGWNTQEKQLYNFLDFLMCNLSCSKQRLQTSLIIMHRVTKSFRPVFPKQNENTRNGAQWTRLHI